MGVLLHHNIQAICSVSLVINPSGFALQSIDLILLLDHLYSVLFCASQSHDSPSQALFQANDNTCILGFRLRQKAAFSEKSHIFCHYGVFFNKADTTSNRTFLDGCHKRHQTFLLSVTVDALTPGSIAQIIISNVSAGYNEN